MLTGHLPFDDDNVGRLLAKIKTGKYIPLTSVSHEAKDLIKSMLTLDPAKRITVSTPCKLQACGVIFFFFSLAAGMLPLRLRAAAAFFFFCSIITDLKNGLCCFVYGSLE